jgi:hypothetical protein
MAVTLTMRIFSYNCNIEFKINLNHKIQTTTFFMSFGAGMQQNPAGEDSQGYGSQTMPRSLSLEMSMMLTMEFLHYTRRVAFDGC